MRRSDYPAGLMSRLISRAALARPLPLSLLCLLATAAAFAVASLGYKDVEVDGRQLADSDSARAEATLRAGLGREATLSLVVAAESDADLITSEASKVALRTIKDRLRAFDSVAKARTAAVSANQLATVYEITFAADADHADREVVLDAIDHEVDSGPLALYPDGRLTGLVDGRDFGLEQLGRGALIALPALLLLAGLAVGVRLIFAPLLSAAMAAGLTLAALVTVAPAVEQITVIALPVGGVVAALLGFEVAIELVRRHRRRWPVSPEPGQGALAASLSGLLRQLWISSIATAALAVATCLAVRDHDLEAVAIAVAVASLVVAVIAPLTTAAALVLGGARGRAGEPPPPRRRLEGLLSSRVVAALSGILAVACVGLGVIGGGLTLIGSGSRDLPEDEAAKQADSKIVAIGGPGLAEPLLVDAPFPISDPRVAELRAEIGAVAGVDGVSYPQAAEDDTAIRVRINADPGSTQAVEIVTAVRAAVEPYDALVGGRSAAADEVANRLSERAALLLLAAIVIATLAIVAARSSLRPRLLLGALPIGLCAVIPAAAAVGFLELAYGSSGLHDLFDFQSRDAAHLGALFAALGILLSIGIWRTVNLTATDRLNRVRSSGQAALSPVATTLRLAPAQLVVTATAAIGLASLLPVDFVVFSEFGFMTAAGLLVDLLVVRLLLAPNLIRLVEKQPGATTAAE